MTLARAAALRRGSVLHPARFDLRPAFQPFQPRNLLAQLRYDPLLLGVLLEQRQHQLLQLGW
jgi:hypothetical protein